MKRVLVTGAGGQLATELVRWAPLDAEVIALGVDALDICDRARIDAVFAEVRPDAVFNAAAYTAVDLAETESDIADRVNHRAVADLRAACDARGARFVHVSTDYVFDGESSRAYQPGDATCPTSVYGRTKRDGELAALKSHDALVVRTAWVYSSHGKNFMRTMLRLMQERDEVRVVADQIGTPTSAAGLARALWSLHAAGATGIHHWTDAGVASWYDFAVAIREESAALGFATARTRVTPIRTVDYPTPARRPAMGLLSKDATWALLGRPAPHWREALRATLAESSAASQAAAVTQSTTGAR